MRPTTVDLLDLDEVVEAIHSPHRDTPLVLISADNSGRIEVSPAAVADAVPDTPVYVLADPDVVTAARDKLGWHFEAFGGAVRIIGRLGQTHFLIRRREVTLERVKTHLLQAWKGFAGASRARGGDDSANTPQRIPGAVPAPPAPRPEIRTPPGATPTKQPPKQPKQLPQQQPTQQPEAPAAGAVPCDHEAELAAITSRLDTLVATQQKILDLLRAQAVEPEKPREVLFDDPEEQLRYDVQQAYLRRYSPQEREEHPLREYTVGPEFLDSITDPKFELATPTQIVNAIVDVLTGYAYTSKSRQAHPHLVSRGGLQATRASDNASAYRCSINANNGAPRLLWWHVPSHPSIELARVAHHDDYRIA